VSLLAILLFAAASVPASLEKVKAEPDLEKRSELALDYGRKVLKDTRTAYDEGKLDEVKTLVSEVEAAVQLSLQSLEDTKKNPRRKSKYFKRAEIKTRDMLREADALSQHMSYADRPMLEPLRKQLHDANDELLRGIMGMK
jgi:hypothetical protein